MFINANKIIFTNQDKCFLSPVDFCVVSLVASLYVSIHTAAMEKPLIVVHKFTISLRRA